MLDEMRSQNTLDHLVKVYRGEEQSNLHDAYIKIKSKNERDELFLEYGTGPLLEYDRDTAMDDLLEYAIKTLNMKPKPKASSDFVASGDRDMERYVCDVWLYEAAIFAMMNINKCNFIYICLLLFYLIYRAQSTTTSSVSIVLV